MFERTDTVRDRVFTSCCQYFDRHWSGCDACLAPVANADEIVDEGFRRSHIDPCNWVCVSSHQYTAFSKQKNSGCIASMIRIKFLSLILDPTIGFYSTSHASPFSLRYTFAKTSPETVAPLMMMCIIELCAGLLACSLATLRPLLALWLEMTASSRYFSKSHYTSSRSGEEGTARIRSTGRLSRYVLPELPKHTRDVEKGRDTELVNFPTRGATFLDTRGGRSEDSDAGLV